MTDSTARGGAAITVEALPARYGDCLLVSCPTDGGTWRLLVDAGPEETWPLLRDRLCAIPTDDQGRRTIDLVIVSHIDNDHIGGARSLFTDEELGLAFDDVWFNGRRHLPEPPPDRGAAQGEALSTLLSGSERPLPWNDAFGGAAVVTPEYGQVREVPTLPGHPRLTLLSPAPGGLVGLAKVWDTELAKLRRRESNTEGAERGRTTDFPDLKRLALSKCPKDGSSTNGSSIAVLLEHRGASVLLAADAFPQVLGAALLTLAKARSQQPLAVDALKLSHHGSRGNLVTELLNAVQATRYVVSTNNSRFGHPDDEALARIVMYGGDEPTLCFNYATERNLRWADEELQRAYHFRTEFPQHGGSGMTVRVPAMESFARSPAGRP